MTAGSRLVYGFHAVSARLRQRATSVREVYVAEGRQDARTRGLLDLVAARNLRLVLLPMDRLDRMIPGVRHQGVACSVDATAPRWDVGEILDGLANEPALLLMLDGVQDPHNLGACLRSADAMGVHMVIAPKDRSVGLTPVVEKVASGAAETVPYVMVTNLARTIQDLQSRGIFVIGLAGEADMPLAGADLSGPTALALGAEGTGLRRLTRERCDALIRIPMAGAVESLNVSVATGICLYEARRQRDSRASSAKTV